MVVTRLMTFINLSAIPLDKPWTEGKIEKGCYAKSYWLHHRCWKTLSSVMHCAGSMVSISTTDQCYHYDKSY